MCSQIKENDSLISFHVLIIDFSDHNRSISNEK
jgi:hypothetical protein